MARLVTISVEYDGVPRIGRREINREVKIAYKGMAETWHSQFRDKHFRATAFGEYGYTSRSRKYEAFKKRVAGHKRPLEFSGESRRLSRSKRIQATSKGASVVMPVRAFNFRAKGSKVDMRREFTTVTDREQSTLERQEEQKLTRRLNRLSKRKKVTK